MLIWSLLSIFGLWIAHRTANECESLQIFPAKSNSWLRVFIFLTLIPLNFAFRNHMWMHFTLLIVIFLSPLVASVIVRHRREALLRHRFVPILDYLILSMKSGRGFRTSLQNCVESQEFLVQFFLKEFLGVLEFRRTMECWTQNPHLLEFFHELEAVDQSTHKPIDRLKAFRRRLMIERKFRQKSRQALLQVRMQSWVLSVMYVGLLGYVHFQFRLSSFPQIVLISLGCFVVGLWWIQRLGRTYRWKL